MLQHCLSKQTLCRRDCGPLECQDRHSDHGRQTAQFDPKRSLVAADAFGRSCPIPAIRNTRRDRLNWVERWHYRFDRPVMATLRKRSFTAWRHDTCHHANFSASAGRSTGRRISSLMRGCRSSEPRITAWT